MPTLRAPDPLGLGIGEERVHLPRQAVGVVHPELVRLGILHRYLSIFTHADS